MYTCKQFYTHIIYNIQVYIYFSLLTLYKSDILLQFRYIRSAKELM